MDAHLGHLAAGAVARQGQRRVDARRDRKVNLRRQMVEEIGERFVKLRGRDEMIVVEEDE